MKALIIEYYREEKICNSKLHIHFFYNLVNIVKNYLKPILAYANTTFHYLMIMALLKTLLQCLYIFLFNVNYYNVGYCFV